MYDEIMILLSDLLSFESYEGNDDKYKILDYVLDKCSNIGYSTKKVGDDIGWAEIGSGSDMVAFPLHLDVVPAGDGWEFDPYKLTINNDILYGRGICDNKGPSAIFISLIAHMSSYIRNKNIRVRLIFGASEESGMSCIRQYVQKEELPVLGFVPDALFPAVIGEKGRLHLKLTLRNIEEWIDEIKGGNQVNSVPDICYLKLNELNENKWFDAETVFQDDKIIVNGTPSHAANPEKGDNAILKLLRLVSKKYHSLAINQLLSLSDEIQQLASDKIFGQVTANIGMCHYHKGLWEVEIDLRYGETISKEALLTIITTHFFNWDIQLLNEKPLHLVKETQYIRELKTIYNEEFDTQEQESLVIGGGTYASYFPGFIAYGPKITTIRTYGHAANEQMSVKHFKQLISLYEKAIIKTIEAVSQ